jgi:hypothetical protein
MSNAHDGIAFLWKQTELLSEGQLFAFLDLFLQVLQQASHI